MTADPRPTSYSRVTLARIMDVGDANLLGNVHGGVIMKAVDDTGGACAARHCRGPAVTAAMDEMVFEEPVRVGDILTTRAMVNWVGRTSLEVGVRVTAQRWNDAGEAEHRVASAYLVFVPIGPDERPLQVPELVLESEDDERRWREAEIRRQHRLAKRDEIRQGRAAR